MRQEAGPQYSFGDSLPGRESSRGRLAKFDAWSKTCQKLASNNGKGYVQLKRRKNFPGTRVPVLLTPLDCSEKAQLHERVKAAMGDLMLLNNRQIDAVVAGDTQQEETTKRELAVAGERLDAAILAYKDHTRQHGC